MQISEEDLTQALTAAVTCCILASAGPQRSRVLAKLYKDERCARLPLFPFLQKVFLDRILTRGEVRLCSVCFCVYVFGPSVFVGKRGLSPSQQVAQDITLNLHCLLSR